MDSLAKITQQLIGREYNLGETDCFSTVYMYLKNTRKEIPTEWRGLTFQSYAELYKKDPDAAKQTMTDFLNEFLDEISAAKAFAGDILLCSLRGNPVVFPAIHGGNGNIICATEEHGVTVMPLRYYNINRAWRSHG